MSDVGNKTILYLIVATLLATGMIGICCYFIYGIEIAIASIFGALLGFTIIHLVLFYFWLQRKSE